MFWSLKPALRAFLGGQQRRDAHGAQLAQQVGGLPRAPGGPRDARRPRRRLLCAQTRQVTIPSVVLDHLYTLDHHF